ncbi:hypothetical protein [Klebsiella phage vB_KvaS_F1M1D]|nr:hypothetical protein [Klebsiella phage vB_KvaS_F1M1D]
MTIIALLLSNIDLILKHKHCIYTVFFGDRSRFDSQA